MLFALFATIAVQAQRIGCVVHSEERSGTRTESYNLPEPMDFDPQATYRQPVVLISFKDQDFSMIPKSIIIVSSMRMALTGVADQDVLPSISVNSREDV